MWSTAFDPGLANSVSKVLSPNVRESKTVLDSGFQVLDSSLCQWNLDSGFQSLMEFGIPWAVFQIQKPKIPDFTYKISRI